MATTLIPEPKKGVNAYGMVPGAVTDVDPSQLYKYAYPTLGADLGVAQSNTGSLLRGEIPDDTARGVWDRRAASAAAGGVAGTPFTGGNTARDLGLTRFQLQQQGGDNLNNMLSTLYPTTVAPAIDLAETNAQLAAAPDPEMAAREQEATFMRQQQLQFDNQMKMFTAQLAAQQNALKASQVKTPKIVNGIFRKPGENYGGVPGGFNIPFQPRSTNGWTF